MKTLFPFLLLLSSCATYQLHSTNVVADNFFVFRQGYSGSASRMQVFVDGKLVGKMLGYRHLSFSLLPGNHEVYFKFSPLVSRSAKRSFTITPGTKKIFRVQKGFLNYGVQILEEESLPADFEEKLKPRVRLAP